MSSAFIERLLQPIVIIVAAMAVIASIRSVARQIQVTAYLDFTKRYSDIVRPLNRLLRKYKESENIIERQEVDREDLTGMLEEYFRLISIEHLLFESRHIDHRTWEIWSLGTNAYFENPLVREGWIKGQRRYVRRSFIDFMNARLQIHSG